MVYLGALENLNDVMVFEFYSSIFWSVHNVANCFFIYM
jgi:hypothetical protein